MHIVELVDGQPFEGDANLRDVGKFIYEGDRQSRWIGEKDAWAHGYWAYDFHDGPQRIESIDTARRVISLAPPDHHWGYRLCNQDPHFVDPDHLNFQLQDDSPAWMIGFEQDRTSQTTKSYRR